MALFHITSNALNSVKKTDFQEEALRERQDIQRLLKDNVNALGDDLLVIAEEYGEFQESKRRIDLLALDKDANLVVIELKRTSDGGHMELQAVRYAAMVANMTWDNAVSAYKRYLGNDSDAEKLMLEYLEWDEPRREDFAITVRIILAAADFSKEITTSVLWLNQCELDITCVRLSLYKLNDELILNAEQIIPLPETENYQVAVREKRRDVRTSTQSEKDRSTYSLIIDGAVYESGFKKSHIGYYTVKAIESKGLINQSVFDFLRADKSCGHALLKTLGDMTDTEKKYSRYRFKQDPEIYYDNQGYYIARNWGVNNIQGFIDAIHQRFSNIKIEKELNLSFL